MKKLAQLSNPALYALMAFILLVVYLLAIKPTVKLYGDIKELENFENSSIQDQLPKGNIKELQKLEELLSKLEPQQNIQSTVLKAVGSNRVKLQSFKEVKIGEKEFGAASNLSKYVLLVSGSYKDLLALVGELNVLAISSSHLYINEEQIEMLSLNILERKNVND